jgi:hypothetical protein
VHFTGFNPEEWGSLFTPEYGQRVSENWNWWVIVLKGQGENTLKCGYSM